MESQDYVSVASAVEAATGKRPSPATLWRWCTKGVLRNGRRIVLRSIMFGGKRHCLPSWVHDFNQACTSATQSQPSDSVQTSRELLDELK